jgi:hypothetical protein
MASSKRPEGKLLVEQDEFRCKCGSVVTIAWGERKGFFGTTKTFFTAYCFDCGRWFSQLEIELILYRQRMLRQRRAGRSEV